MCHQSQGGSGSGCTRCEELPAEPFADGPAARGGGLEAYAGGRGRLRERAHALQVASLLPQGRGGGAARSLLGAALDCPPHSRGAAGGDRGLAMAASEGSARCRRGSPGSSRLEPPEPAKRYERRRPGELLHTGVKKLGRPGRPGDRVNGDRRTRRRGIGCSRTRRRRARWATADSDERARAHLRAHGIRIERVMSDNGSAYVSRARARLQDARDQTPAHPPLPSAHERQSRALHPHPARRLGLRRHLRQLPRAAPRPHRLARLLQSTPTTRLP